MSDFAGDDVWETSCVFRVGPVYLKRPSFAVSFQNIFRISLLRTVTAEREPRGDGNIASTIAGRGFRAQRYEIRLLVETWTISPRSRSRSALSSSPGLAYIAARFVFFATMANLQIRSGETINTDLPKRYNSAGGTVQVICRQQSAGTNRQERHCMG